MMQRPTQVVRPKCADTKRVPERHVFYPTIRAHRGLIAILIFLTIWAPSFLVAQPYPSSPNGTISNSGGDDGDKSLSPYFLVKSDDPALDQLPLKSSAADVKIAGVIADINVSQVYKNEGKKPIEAIYVFPASTRAAVYGLKMTIADRTIVAVIKKKEEARQEYEQAKRQGKSASLLEQERPNVFTMNVANILPGDEIKVEMKYTELLVPSEGVYELVYPTVVGPRYNNPATSSDPKRQENWVANPYLKEGEAPKTTFDIKVALSAGLPIQEAVCETHKVNVAYEGQSFARITLDPSEKYGGNRDFILKYRLAGGKVESGLLLTQGDKENFFLLMVQPPKRVEPKQLPKREYIFIVDISGSMHGFPLEISKNLLKSLIGNLKPTDVFNVLLFAGSAQVLSESGSLPANEENIKKAIDVITRQEGGGGTELLPALRKALDLPRTPNTSRTMIIATDGFVSVENDAFDLVRKNLGNANFFSFGIGTSVNRHLMEGLARAGMGEPFIISKPDQAAAQAEKFRKYVETPVLTSVKADFGDFDVHAVEPPAIPDVLAERPVIVFGKWKGKTEGTITVSGVSGEGEYKQTFDVASTKPMEENSALRYLWARHRIAVLSDFNTLRNDKEIVEEVTKLGLDYNLLTAYTSFVAVDSLVRTQQPSTQVKQALPLPEGVSNLAVGGAVMSKQMALSSSAPGGAAPEMSFDSSRSMEKEEYAPSAEFKSRGISASPMPSTPPPPPPPMKKFDKPARIVNATVANDKSDAKAAGEKVTIGGIMASGKLTVDAVRAIFEKKIQELTDLYKKTRATNLKLAGKLGLELKIAPNGSVRTVKIITNEVSDKGFEKDVIDLVKGITFDKPGSSDDIEITVVFTFSTN
ncbi:MAG: AgmX/PglI C-terminal domain-containing protein [Candidatus Riflebacteria bacterium]|nr:AgmX/PglI C-terminal domain-containing protein [Candidatus Riflebacteria bacterium]